MRSILIGAVVAATLVGAERSVAACSCYEMGGPVDVEFIGVAVESKKYEQPPGITTDPGGGWLTRFRVEQVQRGKPGASVWIRHGLNTGSCGYGHFMIDMRYRVRADDDGTGLWTGH